MDSGPQTYVWRASAGPFGHGVGSASVPQNADRSSFAPAKLTLGNGVCTVSRTHSVFPVSPAASIWRPESLAPDESVRPPSPAAHAPATQGPAAPCATQSASALHAK